MQTIGTPDAAMTAALAAIAAGFGKAAAINGFKGRVKRLLLLGPQHPMVRARFGGRAALLGGRSLAASVVTVDRWWRDERKAFAIACALGGGTRLSLDILTELRLVLRLLRRKRMYAYFPAIVAAFSSDPIAEAAE